MSENKTNKYSHARGIANLLASLGWVVIAFSIVIAFVVGNQFQQWLSLISALITVVPFLCLGLFLVCFSHLIQISADNAENTEKLLNSINKPTVE